MNEMITTIIPTFRRPALLKKAILSVLSQSHPNFQVCVYDNASGDETEEVVKELMRQDARVKYHRHPENIGMMANYQFALARVDTPYFSLLSDDDILLPTFYDTALKGFDQFQDVAFSACAVKAIDENEQFVSEPMHNWDREGYFDKREGIVEMIKKPFLPVGILFNYQLVKDVEIDSSETIQIRWDTDYLLQIISRHPFVINKKICAIFLSHSQGFSTGRYREMFESSRKFDDHFNATVRICQRLMPTLDSFPEIKIDAKRAFDYELKQNFFWFINFNTDKKISLGICKLILIYRNHFGMDMLAFKLILRSFVFRYLPWIVPIVRWIRSRINASSKGAQP